MPLNSSLLTRALNRVFTPVMQVKGYFLISLTKPGDVAGVADEQVVAPRRTCEQQAVYRQGEDA